MLNFRNSGCFAEYYLKLRNEIESSRSSHEIAAMYSKLVHNNYLAVSTFKSQAAAPQAQIYELDEKTNYCFRYLR